LVAQTGETPIAEKTCCLKTIKLLRMLCLVSYSWFDRIYDHYFVYNNKTVLKCGSMCFLIHIKHKKYNEIYCTSFKTLHVTLHLSQRG